MPNFDLTDRIAIVTGGSQGIGQAISLALAEHGAHIVIASRTADKVEAVCQEVRALGRTALGIPADLTDPAQVTAMVERAKAEFGRIDILVNNAGGSPETGRRPLLDVGPEGYYDTFDMNFKSMFFCAQAVVPIMQAQGKGTIINLSSMAGRDTEPPRVGFSMYAAAKAAINQMSRYMALEWGPSIRTNVLAPGFIDSGRVTPSRTPERIARRMETVALGRPGTVAEMAAVVVFLASDAASYVNGACIDADGGIVSPHSAV